MSTEIVKSDTTALDPTETRRPRGLAAASSTAEGLREGVSPPPGNAGAGPGTGRDPGRGTPGASRRKGLQGKQFRVARKIASAVELGTTGNNAAWHWRPSS